jgi:hypothetical protein
MFPEPDRTAPSGGAAVSELQDDAVGLPGRRLTVVPPFSEPVHEHTWTLRETEYDENGLTTDRFECECGDVSYT